jgi:hypothetical protein
VELGADWFERKKPRFVVSEDFEFQKFGTPADVALAQSLFTHLPASLVERCLRRLRQSMSTGGVFFATYFECAQAVSNPDRPDDHGYFAYTRVARGGTRSTSAPGTTHGAR